MKFKTIKITDINVKKVEEQDSLIRAIGEFGKWQLMIMMLIQVPVKTSAAWQQLGIIFLAPKTTFKCVSMNTTAEVSKCYDDCKEYEYFTEFQNTIISQWDLICNRAWMSNFTQTVTMFGVLIGSIVFGFIADRYGRRLALLIACMIQLATSLIVSFCPTYWTFTIVRFIIGTSTAGTLLCSFILMMETIGSSKRELVSCLCAMPIPFGEMVMPIFAYYLRTWNKFCLGVAVPNLLYLVYLFILPESPKWLISMGRLDEASDVMTQAAKWNNLPSDNMIDVAKSIAGENANSAPAQQTKVTYLDLFKTRTLRKHVLCSCVIWFILGISFYGSNQYIGQTSSNVFVSISVAGALQMPGVLIVGFLCKYIGRRITLISVFVVCSMSNALLAVFADKFYVCVVMGAIGVSCAAGAFGSVYLYTAELFPTVTRNMALGASSTVSRLGSMLAPFIAGLGATAAWLPPTAFAIAPLVAAVACYCLPETKGKKLSDHLT